MRKSARSRAAVFSDEAKKEIFKRDCGRCIFCGKNYQLTFAHYISRAKGGLGVAKNGVLLCLDCHYETDFSQKRKIHLATIKNYLSANYQDWEEKKLFYKKGEQYEND